MRHPGAPSERELVDEVVRLRAINADLLAALELAREWLDEVTNPDNYDLRTDEGMAARAEIDTAVAKARGEEQ